MNGFVHLNQNLNLYIVLKMKYIVVAPKINGLLSKVYSSFDVLHLLNIILVVQVLNTYYIPCVH